MIRISRFTSLICIRLPCKINVCILYFASSCYFYRVFHITVHEYISIRSMACGNFTSLLLSYQRKAGLTPCQPSLHFSLTPAIELLLFSLQTVSFSRCHTKGASQATFWYDNEKDLKVCFCVAWFILRVYHNFRPIN